LTIASGSSHSYGTSFDSIGTAWIENALGTGSVTLWARDEINKAPFFFPFASGTIEWEVVMESNQPGAHTIKAWLLDSRGSISNVVEFVVEIRAYRPL
jgi:hypothetical protein